MGQKIIRNIPQETLRVIAARAAQEGKSEEAWIRDLLQEMTTIRSDENAYEMISYYIGQVDTLLDEIKEQVNQWTTMDRSQIKEEVEHPVQCLMCLLYIHSDLLHAQPLFNRMLYTLKNSSERNGE